MHPSFGVVGEPNTRRVGGRMTRLVRGTFCFTVHGGQRKYGEVFLKERSKLARARNSSSALPGRGSRSGSRNFRERAKADVEAEWHGSKPVGCARNDRGWRTLKDLLVSEIKADKSEERLARRRVTLRSLLISLQVYVHLVASPEDTSHAGHQFFPVRDKRIDRYFLILCANLFQRQRALPSDRRAGC